jgi:hypothetical protein
MAEFLQKACPSPKFMHHQLRDSIEDKDREARVSERAQLARDRVLKRMAYVRESEQRRWLANRCAREHNFTRGDFKVRHTGLP